jgi:hypothetical protein
MAQFADIKITDKTEVIGSQTVFHNGDPNKPSVLLNTPPSGQGVIRVYSGSENTQMGGFFLQDRVNNRTIGALRNGQTVEADELASMRIFLDAEYGNVVVGGNGRDGDLLLRNEQGQVMVHMTSGFAGEGNTVNRIVTPDARLRYNATLSLLQMNGPSGGRLQICDSNNAIKIDLNGFDGKATFADIRLGQGTAAITSLLDKIRQLEARIAALEAR